MPCKDLIAYELKPLPDTGKVADALDSMEDAQLEQLPVVDEKGLYLGILTFEMLSNAAPAATLKDLVHQMPLLKAAVNERAFPYRAAKVMFDNGLDMVPVVNDADELQGMIDKKNMLGFLVEQTGLLQSGGIIILEVKSFNYSLSEIARICETNDVLILNLQIKSIPDEDALHIILKTNTRDLSAVQAAFSRYEYNVSVIEGDLNTNSLVQERYDLLMNFLKM